MFLTFVLLNFLALTQVGKNLHTLRMMLFLSALPHTLQPVPPSILQPAPPHTLQPALPKLFPRRFTRQAHPPAWNPRVTVFLQNQRYSLSILINTFKFLNISLYLSFYFLPFSLFFSALDFDILSL